MIIALLPLALLTWIFLGEVCFAAVCGILYVEENTDRDIPTRLARSFIISFWPLIGLLLVIELIGRIYRKIRRRIK